MIAKILDLLSKHDFPNAGEYTEIAKGKYEIVKDFKTFKSKIKRQWQSRK
jgi:hypothetical protein